MENKILKELNESILKYKYLSNRDNIVKDYINIEELDYIKSDYDLYNYIRAKYNNKKDLLDSYKMMELNDPIAIINKMDVKSLSKEVYVDHFVESYEYNTVEISAVSDNYNFQIGMYNTINSTKEEVSVIKATINENSKYGNYWIEKNIKMNYFFTTENKEENYKERTYSQKTNRLLYFSYIINNPVDVHLFVRYKKGDRYRYHGIFVMYGISDDGKSIQLVKRDKIDSKIVKKYNDIITKESKKILSYDVNGETYKERMNKIRLKQGIFRDLLITNFGDKCMLCEMKGKDFIIASHIKPYSISNSKEVIDINNGLLLCPNHDRLFDRGYISFDYKGKIIISSKIDKIVLKESRLNNEIMLPQFFENNKYLSYHREKIFLKDN